MIKYTKIKYTKTRATGLLLGLLALWSFIIVGWFRNLYWLVALSETADTQFWVALAGAVVVPLGVLHGWITVF